MTLDEVRDQLNLYRQDADWHAAWARRGVQSGEVLLCLRGLMSIITAAFKRLDMPKFCQYADLALAYAKGDWIEFEVPLGYKGPVGPLMKGVPAVSEDDPEATAEEQKAAWVKFIKGANPQWTYGQAIAFFEKKFGYWPKRAWPGMPLYEMDRLSRIKHVKPCNLVPFPDTGGMLDGNQNGEQQE